MLLAYCVVCEGADHLQSSPLTTVLVRSVQEEAFEAAALLIVLRLWRVIRIVNGEWDYSTHNTKQLIALCTTISVLGVLGTVFPLIVLQSALNNNNYTY